MAQDLFDKYATDFSDTAASEIAVGGQDLFAKYATEYKPEKVPVKKPEEGMFEKYSDKYKQDKTRSFGETLGALAGQVFGMGMGPGMGLVGADIGEEIAKKLEEAQVPARFARGLKRGAGAIALRSAIGYPGKPDKLVRENETMLGHIAEILGEAASDLPVMAVAGALGAKPGAALGAALGSVAPGVGTALGAGVGGAVTGASAALAVPSIMKTAYQEYNDFLDRGGNLTFEEFIKSAKAVGAAGAKSAAVGAVLGVAGRLTPLLKKLPGFAKVMSSKPGAAAVEAVAELGALTGAQAAVERERPTAQSVVDNLALLLFYRFGTRMARGTKKFFTELAKPETRTRAEAFLKMLPEETQKRIKERYPRLGEETQKQKFKQVLRENIGERSAKMYETQTELGEAFEKAQKKVKFKPKELEEAMYYKQKTGNPEIKGDTFEKLSERLPKDLRSFVDKDITNHFAKMADMWNKNPRTRNINPRDVVRELFLPGLYEYNTKQFNKAYDSILKKFKIEGPFVKPKEYITFLDAFRAEGLKPRYKNIMDMVNAYNNQVIKTMANINLLENIAEVNKDNPDPIVTTTFDGQTYKDAKRAGYVPFDDLFLRSHKMEPVPKGEIAKRMWKASDAPALVHPDFADVFQGIFSKEGYKGTTTLGKALKLYDQASDLARYTRVEMSPFHYFSLMESAIGSGIALKKPNWYAEGGRLRQNKAIMADAIKHGLKMDYRITETGGKKGLGVVSKGLEMMKRGADNLPENLASKGAQKSLELISKGTNNLFEQFHPRLKLSTYNHYVNQEIIRRVKAGENITPKSAKLIKQGIADFVNNIYGGQNWDYMSFFNKRSNVKKIRRIVGYPDWTISTIRQALDATAPGVKGKIARQYWKRYGAAMLGVTGALRFLSSGLIQRDDENYSIGGLAFDYTKGLRGLFERGPRALYVFPLPDVNIKLPFIDTVVNPGRDWKGFKLVGHFGKQALELLNYVYNPVQAFFSKANPLLQDILIQIWGGTPKAGGNIWRAEAAKDRYGQLKSWGAKESFIGQVPYRILNVLRSKLPFSAQTLTRTGWAPFAMSLFGAYPISKAINTFTARPFLEDALYEKDEAMRNRKLESIHDIMRTGGIDSQTIRKETNKVRTAIEKERHREDLSAAIEKNDAATIRNIRKMMLKRKVSKGAVTTFINTAIKEKFDTQLRDAIRGNNIFQINDIRRQMIRLGMSSKSVNNYIQSLRG